MTNYEAVEKSLSDLETIEGRLKALRDNSGQLTQAAVNNALRIISDLYQPLHGIDKALETEKTGGLIL